MAHIILIDPHNEYGRAFGRTAEVVNIDNLQLPFWLFDFEEAVGILVRGGTAQEQEAQALILKDAITRARPALRGRKPCCDYAECGYTDAVPGIRSPSFHLRGDRHAR